MNIREIRRMAASLAYALTADTKPSTGMVEVFYGSVSMADLVFPWYTDCTVCAMRIPRTDETIEVTVFIGSRFNTAKGLKYAVRREYPK